MVFPHRRRRWRRGGAVGGRGVARGSRRRPGATGIDDEARAAGLEEDDRGDDTECPRTNWSGEEDDGVEAQLPVPLPWLAVARAGGTTTDMVAASMASVAMVL